MPPAPQRVIRRLLGRWCTSEATTSPRPTRRASRAGAGGAPRPGPGGAGRRGVAGAVDLHRRRCSPGPPRWRCTGPRPARRPAPCATHRCARAAWSPRRRRRATRARSGRPSSTTSPARCSRPASSPKARPPSRTGRPPSSSTPLAGSSVKGPKVIGAFGKRRCEWLVHSFPWSAREARARSSAGSRCMSRASAKRRSRDDEVTVPGAHVPAVNGIGSAMTTVAIGWGRIGGATTPVTLAPAWFTQEDTVPVSNRP